MDISKDKRKQIIYQKTEFNTFSICQYNSILKCIKCKRNNNILENKNAATITMIDYIPPTVPITSNQW